MLLDGESILRGLKSQVRQGRPGMECVKSGMRVSFWSVESATAVDQVSGAGQKVEVYRYGIGTGLEAVTVRTQYF